MIMSVEQLRKHITSDKDDEILEITLKAIEQAVRAYTNNNFTVRCFGRNAQIVGQTMILDKPAAYKPGDTVYVDGDLNDGLFTVVAANGDTITVKEQTQDEREAYVAKVEYPTDIIMGVVTLMKWELDAREKSWIQSETVSRHTINYINLDAWNAEMGYPKALVGFLQPYMKARFGRGLDV